jgi:hypothetical protein
MHQKMRLVRAHPHPKKEKNGVKVTSSLSECSLAQDSTNFSSSSAVAFPNQQEKRPLESHWRFTILSEQDSLNEMLKH